jgi:hypothetical protein
MWFHKHLAVRKKCFGHNLETKTQLSNCLVCYIRLTISAASLLLLMAICLTSWRIFSQENVEWVSQNISAHDSFIQKGESKQESRLQRREDIEQVKKQLEILYGEWLLSRCYYDSGKSEEYMTDEEKKLKALQREKCKKIKLVEEQINRILTETEFTSSFEAIIDSYEPKTGELEIVFNSGDKKIIFVSAEKAYKLKQQKNIEGVGKFALFLDAQGKAKEYLIGSDIEIEGQSYKVKPEDIDTKRAMFLLFGNIHEVTVKGKVRSFWKGIDWRKDSMAEEDEKHLDNLYAEAVYTKHFRENGLQKFVIVAGSVPEERYDRRGEEDDIFDDCHACGAIASIAVFVKKDGAWRFEAFNRNIGEYGSWGALPPMKLTKIGSDKHALLFEEGYMAQGATSLGYYYLWHIDGVMQEMLSLNFMVSTLSTSWCVPLKRGCVEADVKIQYLPNKASEYFDIKFLFSGKRAVKVKSGFVMKPFTGFVVYRFSDGSYKEILRKGWIPQE